MDRYILFDYTLVSKYETGSGINYNGISDRKVSKYETSVNFRSSKSILRRDSRIQETAEHGK
jgi:hypothetical protein